MDVVSEIPLRKNKCSASWFLDRQGDQRWICRNQLSSYGFKKEKTHCWYQSCPGRMEGIPSIKKEIPLVEIKEKSKVKETPIVKSDQCNNYGCSKPISESRKKYCSDNCRKQKARSDYETRNPNRRNKNRHS